MPRVLIIDDEAGIRAALERWFSRQGWTTVLAEDGDEALQLIRQSADDDDDTRVDVVLCDMHLPRLSGADLHATLLHERPSLVRRMIFSTGDPIADATAGSVLASHAFVLQKPFEFAALRVLITAILAEA